MGYVLLFVAILLAIEPFCLEDENDVTEYGVYTREVEKALEALSSKENAETKPKEVNRWHWAYRKVMQKDQWDSVCSFAVQAVKKKHSRSKVRAIGDARTLRYVTWPSLAPHKNLYVPCILDTQVLSGWRCEPNYEKCGWVMY